MFNAATLGSAAYDQNFLRPYQGYGGITRRTNYGNNTFHSLQTSWNRRFRDGLQFTLNYTLSRDVGLNGGDVLQARQRAAKSSSCRKTSRPSTASRGADRTHTVKGNFVWDLPDVPTDGATS